MSDATLTRPSVRPAPAWSFPAHHDHTLSNGLRVAIFELPGQHVTSTRLNLPVPMSAEPAGREGVATLVSRTMDEGTSTHTADEMAELFERGGIGLQAGVSVHGIWVDLEATARNADRAWELARECLAEPAFPESEVNRHRAQRLSQIDHDLADPGYRATLEFVRTFYTPESRSARPLSGSRENVAALTREDLVEFHRQWIRPDGAYLVVAGDVDAQRTIEALESNFGSWKVESPRPVPTTAGQDVPSAERGRVVFVDRPGSVQTELHLGWVGPARVDGAQWAPQPVLSYVVGGTPHARIDRVLREEKGYTYGMRGSFRPRSEFGQFVVSGSVRGDATAAALSDLTEIFAKANEGFTAQEVKEGVDFLSMTAPARYATADQVADEAAALQFAGLDTGFVTDYLAALRTVEVEQVDEAWRQWSSEPRTIVLVGDASAHADSVAALGLGDLTVL
ncbi:M16 family metallopeptidase [Calidifontibacter terrae]